MYQIVFITILLYESIKGLNKFIRIIVRNESLLIIKKIELLEVNQMKICKLKSIPYGVLFNLHKDKGCG